MGVHMSIRVYGFNQTKRKKNERKKKGDINLLPVCVYTIEISNEEGGGRDNGVATNNAPAKRDGVLSIAQVFFVRRRLLCRRKKHSFFFDDDGFGQKRDTLCFQSNRRRRLPPGLAAERGRRRDEEEDEVSRARV